jgi:outer membrane protein TolC
MIFGQNRTVFTLTDCYDSAVNNYPNLQKLLLNKEIFSLNTKNIKSNYYPKLNLNGQISYQSDVTKMPIGNSIPGISIKELDKDWYQINLNIEQMIYDGGLTKSKKKLEEADFNVSDQKMQVELYQLKSNINHLYFNIIFLNKNKEILNILINNLQIRIDDAKTAFENGMLLSSEIDALRVEKNSTTQKIIEIKEDINSLIASMNELSGLDIKDANQLVLQDFEISDFDFTNSRPEYLLLSLQQEKIGALKSLTAVKRMPVLAAFGQAGYGRPGYDMLKNAFDDYYKVGATLRWNIWDWNNAKRQTQVYEIQKQIIDAEKSTFDQNLKADLHKKISDINKYQKLLETDLLIVRLQDNVVETANNQMDNGAITATNYLIEVNKKVKAHLNLEAHKLQLVYSKILYLTAIGKI